MSSDNNHELILKIFKEKTTLNDSEIKLIIELIIFLIKMKLLMSKKVIFRKFGVIYLFQNKTSFDKIVRIRASIYLKSVLKNKRNLDINDWVFLHKMNIRKKVNIYQIIYSMSKILNITKIKALYLLNLFVYGMCDHLLKFGTIDFDGFGEFYLYDDSVKERKKVREICGRKINISKFIKVIFRSHVVFYKELQGKVKKIRVNKILKDILKIHKISLEAPKLPNYVKANKKYTKPYVIKSLNHPSKNKKNKSSLPS